MSKINPKKLSIKTELFKLADEEFLKTQPTTFRSRYSTESDNLYSTCCLTSRDQPKRKLTFNKRIDTTTTPSVDDYLLNQKLFRTWKCL